MGTGVAKQIKEKYPEMFREYKLYCTDDIDILGTTQFCKVNDGKIIANLFLILENYIYSRHLHIVYRYLFYLYY